MRRFGKGLEVLFELVKVRITEIRLSDTFTFAYRSKDDGHSINSFLSALR